MTPNFDFFCFFLAKNGHPAEQYWKRLKIPDDGRLSLFLGFLVLRTFHLDWDVQKRHRAECTLAKP